MVKMLDVDPSTATIWISCNCMKDMQHIETTCGTDAITDDQIWTLVHSQQQFWKCTQQQPNMTNSQYKTKFENIINVPLLKGIRGGEGALSDPCCRH